MVFTPGEVITIPSPVDVHAHLREPGGEDKETIASGTRAALAGGYQMVCDMPNNPGAPTHTRERVWEKIDLASTTTNTDIGFYAGVDLENPNFGEFKGMMGRALGLKLYLGHTTGNTSEYGLDEARLAIDTWITIARDLGHRAPILLHAREGVGAEVADYIAGQGHVAHWCHVSTESEVESVRRLSGEYGGDGLFFAGVTPHHLTMTDRDADLKYGWNGGRMMPPLGKEADGDALLDAFNSGDIAILETDHAPHTKEDKDRAERENPTGDTSVDCTTCFGVSGIEFVLPVMMSLVQRGVIDNERLIDSLRAQPLSMLGIRAGRKAETVLVIEPYTIGESDRAGKSQNNPYVGWGAWGRVKDVIVAGESRFRQRDLAEFGIGDPTVIVPRQGL